jgi:hypothetical protein
MGYYFVTFWKDNVFFILVEPQEPGNVGAAARALQNMGFRNLELVTPGYFRTKEAKRMAYQAYNLLKQAPVYAKLDMFTALIVAGMQGHTVSVNYDQVFKPQSAAIVPIAETECAPDVANTLGTAMGQYAATHNNSLTGYGRTQDSFMTVPVINNFLVGDSQPGNVKLNQRVIIYQGSNDTTVPEGATLLLKAVLASKGTTFEYIDDKFITNVADRWDHSTVVSANVDNIVTDVKSLMPIQ